MSISPTQKRVKRAKIEPKHLNPTDSEKKHFDFSRVKHFLNRLYR